MTTKLKAANLNATYSADEYLKTSAAGALSWGAVDALPSQTSESGKFLTTDGSDASWAAVASSGFTSVQVIPSTGTWTKPVGVGITKILVFITGGGAGGNYRAGDWGTGGGAASTAIKFIDVSAIASVDVTIGLGGVGGSASDPYNAPAGGASAFGVAPATVHCTAGGGGATSGTSVPGPGGTATSGDLNITGGGGTYGGGGAGQGGASFWGNGTSARYSSGYLSPLANNIYGSGGGGSRAAASGSGGNGVCFVLEYK